ncbi:HAD-IA family hydrolase [Pedosphaera parvula]|nr:HAD-IA family hydrolase [Pedosphaera parvula]
MTTRQKVEAITFDVGGTLIKPWPSVGHVYAKVAAENGLKNLSPEILNRQFGAAWKGLESFNHGREEWAALVDKTFAGTGTEPPSQTFFPQLYDRFSEPEVWHVFEDVVPALEVLASHRVKLGIISNWDERLIPLLRRLKLDTYFEAIVVSCNVGFPKPSSIIFEHAARKLGVAPERILHVGDSLDHDIKGATTAGFQTRLIDRNRESEPSTRIKFLHELEVEVA